MSPPNRGDEMSQIDHKLIAKAIQNMVENHIISESEAIELNAKVMAVRFMRLDS